MRRETAKVTAWLLAVSVAGMSQSALAQGRPQPKVPQDKKAEAQVHFFLLKDGTECTVVKYDGSASAKVHKQVRWVLKNECGGRRRIEFRNFRKLDEAAADCAGASTPGQPGPGKLDHEFNSQGRIVLLLDDNSPGRWCFDVHLDNSDKPIDPMIRIDR